MKTKNDVNFIDIYGHDNLKINVKANRKKKIDVVENQS